MPTLYISDLDGTLLGPNQSISDFSLRHLQAMIDEGLAFTVASARSVTTMIEVLRGLRLKLPFIASNGAFIHDPLTGRRRTLAEIDRPLVVELYELARSMGCAPLLSIWDGGADTLLMAPADPTNGGMAWYLGDRFRAGDKRLRETADPLSRLSGSVVCLSLIHRREALEPIRVELLRRYPGRILLSYYENMYEAPWHWLTIHPTTATKAHALDLLVGELGYAPADLVVFGDHDNDIPMFKFAGRGVAVEGATEPLKRHAAEQIGPHHEDSVVRYIMERWIKGKS